MEEFLGHLIIIDRNKGGRLGAKSHSHCYNHQIGVIKKKWERDDCQIGEMKKIRTPNP